MRIVRWVDQACGQRVGLRQRHPMFLVFRLGMPLRFMKPGILGQVTFPKPVGTHDLRPLGTAGRGQTQFAVRKGDEPALGEVV